MPGCIQPMSSPMMKRILGFCAGCCAVAGVLASPDSDINIVAPSSPAQDRLCRPGVLRGGVAIKGGLSGNMELNMTTLSRLWCIGGSSPDAPEAKMTRGSINRLSMTRCRPVASAVVRRAQMRAAFDDPSWNFYIGGSGVVAVGLAAAARVLRNAASLRRICLMLWRIPVCGPFPDVADHVEKSITVRRECGDRRSAFKTVGIDVLPWKLTLPGICHVTAGRREFIAPGKFGAV